MPMCPSLLRANHRALPYLMFIKQKCIGQIKGRGCVDGWKERLHHSKEDANSPTVAVESVMLTSAIDAIENRDVATVDIPEAFMQVDMDKEVYVKIGGTMVDLFTGPKYEKCVALENGRKVLFARLYKALYEALRAALLFWKKLTMTLKEWGFTISPDDTCVATCQIDWLQCTII
jgi:Reverse transcriptase (RNA-dependent DNA polymerase)